MLFNRWRMVAVILACSLGMQPALAGNGVTLARQDGPVVFVAYSPDAKQIITATYEGAIRKWDAASGRLLQQIEKPYTLQPGIDVRCRVAALSPNGKVLGVVTYASILNLYNVTTGKLFRQIKTGNDQLSGAFAVIFAPDSKTVITSRLQGRALSRWDIASGKELRKFGDEMKGKNPFPVGRTSLAISPGGKVVSSDVNVYKNNQIVGTLVRRWDLATGKELPPAKGAGDGTVIFAADGKTTAWLNWKSREIRLWDLDTDKELRQLEGTGTPRVFAPNGKLLAGRDKDRGLCVWDVQTGKIRKLGGPVEPSLNARADVIAFSADGKKLVSGLGVRVQQWDVATGKEIGPRAD